MYEEKKKIISEKQIYYYTVHSLSIHARERKSERGEHEARGGGGWGLRAQRARRIGPHLSSSLAILPARTTIE